MLVHDRAGPAAGAGARIGPRLFVPDLPARRRACRLNLHPAAAPFPRRTPPPYCRDGEVPRPEQAFEDRSRKADTRQGGATAASADRACARETAQSGDRCRHGGPGSQTGLQQPPDNSWDRRADFAAAHTARKSTPKGFNEAPQSGYGRKRRRANSIPISPGHSGSRRRMGPSAPLPLAGGVGGGGRSSSTRARQAPHPPQPSPTSGEGAAGARRRSHRARARPAAARRPAGIHRQAVGAASSAAPGKIRGRPAARHQVRVRAEGRPAAGDRANWWKASGATTACRCCSASPARARPSPWRR